ncbi:exopolysaccharide biosynthesis polyprenyl glycosylphosphotransferase [Nitratifractor salsuginis]|nr:exopolysaccharide biosynthesis polyprenyl glycosylphosphotransferase [Nitratifractor salsuginis]
MDTLAIVLSIIVGYQLRVFLDDSFANTFGHSLSMYLEFPLIYITTLSMLAYEGIYTKRYDFWHETRQIIKALILSFILVLAFLAMTKSIQEYSRATIIFIFACMMLIIPLLKIVTKKLLYHMGLWQRPASVYGNDPFVTKEIFDNYYLGYTESDKDKEKTVFINSVDTDVEKLHKLIAEKTKKSDEVIFIPLINEYDLTQSTIYQLSNTRTNLIVYKNRLKSKYREIIHITFNYLLAILLLPILLPIIGIIAILIKRESPGPVFFAHMRVGKQGKLIPTLKFRSMYQDAQDRLEKLLETDPPIREEWEKNFKLKNDPRVTKIGAILRKTSLDELPQIFNVLRGEMNFVGPRPVIQQELEQYYKDDAEYYFMVKPGITGLWQVSGRSDTDYDFRVETDKWYVSNWSLWLDIVILLKTVKVVLKRDGAY